MGGAREIASWCAHEALASVTAEPVGRAARAYVTAQNTQTAVRRIYVGAEGVRQDGRRGERMVSAGEWFHGASDRTNALAQLGIDFQALLGDLERHAISAHDAAWVITEVVPALRAWEAFVQREASSALAPWVTEWSVYEAWWDRLTRIRELARARGIILESPDPLPLPKTIWQRGAQGEGSPLDTWFGFLKTGIFAAVAVTGFVSLWAILAQFRRSHESQSGVG